MPGQQLRKKKRRQLRPSSIFFFLNALKFGIFIILRFQDFKGNTALHTMTKYKRLPCIVSLLSHGANVEVIKEDISR